MLLKKASDHVEQNAVKKQDQNQVGNWLATGPVLCCPSMGEVGYADPSTHSGWPLVLRTIHFRSINFAKNILWPFYIYIYIYMYIYI